MQWHGSFECSNVSCVKINFNQGNIALFGDTAGKQSLFSVCCSVVKKVSIWKSYDLDNILIEGDKICKFLNKDGFLSVDELLRRIKIYNCNIDENIELQNLHEGVASQRESFLRNIGNVSDVCSQSNLIFICSYTIAVIPSFGRNGDLNSYFCLIHIVDRGITTCKTGFSVLLQFPNLIEIEKYLEVAYEIANHPYPVYFRFQYLNVNISETDLTYIKIPSERKEKELQRKTCAQRNISVSLEITR